MINWQFHFVPLPRPNPHLLREDGGMRTNLVQHPLPHPFSVGLQKFVNRQNPLLASLARLPFRPISLVYLGFWQS